MGFQPITTYFSQLLLTLASPLIGTRVTPGWMVYLGWWVEGTNVSGLLANNAGKPRTVTNKQPARSHQRHAGEERRQEGLRQNVTG